MRMRTLGPSGIEAPVIGFGAWAIGGWMWGGTDEATSIDAIHASIDAGATFIDTAPAYGFGLSETIVGKAIRDRRDRVVLATKCGLVTNTDRGERKFFSNVRGPDPHGHLSVQAYLGPESVRQEVETSLRRLQTDAIDLIQTHWQDPTTPIEDTMGTLLDLKHEGKVRAIGACNATSAQLEEYRKVGPLDADQELYSMLDRGIENDQLSYCRRHGIAVLAYSPLGRGLLTGKIGPDREFPPGDLRRDDPRFSVDNRRRIAQLLDRFRPLAEDRKLTLAQVAVAWTLQQPGLTHALCGARTRGQALENAVAGTVELSGEELALIDAALAECLAG